MLILNRKVGDQIIIGNTIKLKVLKTKGNKIDLGVEAPKDITVVREEIYEKEQNEDFKITKPEVIAKLKSEKSIIKRDKN